MYELTALLSYAIVILGIGVWSSRSVHSSADFIIGNRSLNYLLTAMAAHASDMSSWLFMAYPAVIFLGGMINAWVAIGLLICMWLNWQLIAPKMRTITGKWKADTFSSYFERRFSDRSGSIRILSAVFCIFFYSVYVCAGLVSLGILTESLFGIHYAWGICLGALLVVAYVCLGGYIALAWLDFFQGIFLLSVIIFVPTYLIMQMGGWVTFEHQLIEKNISLSFIPSFDVVGILGVLSMAFGWGLGYFGQPHIITKFMGIKDVSQIKKSQYIGMTWMLLSLIAATLVGLVGVVFFSSGLKDPQVVFIEMVKESFHPFAAGLILCAIIASTVNVMSSQVLVLCSTITEDIYQKIFDKKATTERLLTVSRFGVLCIAVIALMIAWNPPSTIFILVLYAWTGLGSSFGPLLLLSLYSSNINKYGACAGIIVGGVTSAVWPLLNIPLPVVVDAMVPGFVLGMLSIILVSRLTKSRVGVVGPLFLA